MRDVIEKARAASLRKASSKEEQDLPLVREDLADLVRPPPRARDKASQWWLGRLLRAALDVLTMVLTIPPMDEVLILSEKSE